MAILSPLKSRRLRNHKSETTQQVIIFQIQREWFALPIFAVKQVVLRSDTHGDYHAAGAGLTVYEGKELLVLDIKRQVFGHRPDLENSSEQPSPQSEAAPGYLLIIRNRQEELVGLPIEQPPTVRRVAQSAIVPLPSNYAARVNIQCVSGLIVQSEEHPILFLLNPDQLLQAQPLLPPAS